MPLLSSLAIHDAQTAGMALGELLFSFLDDVYVVASPERIRELYNLLGGATRPPRMDDFCPDVWNSEGIKILGTPVGSVQEVCDSRLEEEGR